MAGGANIINATFFCKEGHPESVRLQYKPSDYNINIINATLFSNKATLNPSVQMSHIKGLKKNTVKYPMRSVIARCTPFPGRPIEHAREHVPRYSAVTSNAVLHRQRCVQYPFYAENNVVNFLAVFVDGRQIPYTTI